MSVDTYSAHFLLSTRSWRQKMTRTASAKMAVPPPKALLRSWRCVRGLPAGTGARENRFCLCTNPRCSSLFAHAALPQARVGGWNKLKIDKSAFDALVTMLYQPRDA